MKTNYTKLSKTSISYLKTGRKLNNLLDDREECNQKRYVFDPKNAHILTFSAFFHGFFAEASLIKQKINIITSKSNGS